MRNLIIKTIQIKKYIVLAYLAFAFMSAIGCISFNKKTEPQNKITHAQFGTVKWQKFALKNSPLLGETSAGQKIYLGGLSSLNFLKTENQNIYFAAITDRGPNAEEFNSLIGVGRNVRPFLIPQFNPSYVELKLDLQSSQLTIQKWEAFRDAKGVGFSGLPPENPKKSSQNQKTQNRFEIPIDIKGHLLKGASQSLDSEGMCRLGHDKLKRVFVSEEYGPDLLSFDENLKLLKRWTPKKGPRANLPEELLKRKLNRGIEGLACSDSFVYLMLQSPLKSGLEKDQDKIRLLKFDPAQEKVIESFNYPIQSEQADKIGDLVYLKNENFLVIEQNGKLGAETGYRKLFRIDLNHKNADPQLPKESILQKEILLDLNELGLSDFEKIEGIARIDNKTIALIVDNDFGLHGPLDLTSSQVSLKSDPLTYLVLIEFEKPIY